MCCSCCRSMRGKSGSWIMKWGFSGLSCGSLLAEGWASWFGKEWLNNLRNASLCRVLRSVNSPFVRHCVVSWCLACVQWPLLGTASLLLFMQQASLFTALYRLSSTRSGALSVTSYTLWPAHSGLFYSPTFQRYGSLRLWAHPRYVSNPSSGSSQFKLHSRRRKCWRLQPLLFSLCYQIHKWAHPRFGVTSPDMVLSFFIVLHQARWTTRSEFYHHLWGMHLRSQLQHWERLYLHSRSMYFERSWCAFLLTCLSFSVRSHRVLARLPFNPCTPLDLSGCPSSHRIFCTFVIPSYSTFSQ